MERERERADQDGERDAANDKGEYFHLFTLNPKEKIGLLFSYHARCE